MGNGMKTAAVAGVAITLGLCWWLLRTEGRSGLEDDGGPAETASSATASSAQAAPSTEAPPSTDAPAPTVNPEPVDVPPPGPEAAPGRIPRDRLPILRAIEPLPGEGERVEIEVDLKGLVTIDGTVLQIEDLMRILGEKADVNRDDGASRVSLMHAVFRVDRDLPWQGAQWLMQTCANPAIRISRIHFAAAGPEAGSEGAIPTWLPIDQGLTSVPHENEPVTVNVGLAAGDTDAADRPEDLDLHLRTRFPDAEPAKIIVVIAATNSVTTGEVLGAAEAARRWGAKEVQFKGTRSPRDYFLGQEVEGIPARKGGLEITVGGKSVESVMTEVLEER
jgi:hypothetical protein